MRSFARSRVPTARRWQQGVSIVEVMVALTLGLVAVAGAAAIYLANRQSFATVESIARLEENARFAMDLLSREIREAGNSVCGGAMISTNLVSASPNWASWDTGLLGDVLVSTASAGKIVGPAGATAQLAGTNSLLVWSGSVKGTSFQITGHNLAAKTITTSDNTGYNANDVIVACDGSQLLTFEVANNAVNKTLTYSDPSAKSPQLSATGGAYLTPLTSHIWYVGSSTTQTGATSLRRLTIKKDGTWGGADNDEMVTGVTGLQIRYLLADTAGVPTGADYQDAATVAGQWALVSAVRLTLTMQTLDNAGSTGSASTVITHDVPLTVSIKVRMQ